jgi:hypothetical protein
MGTRKNFSEHYRKFGHALSKRFSSPGLERLSAEVQMFSTNYLVAGGNEKRRWSLAVKEYSFPGVVHTNSRLRTVIIKSTDHCLRNTDMNYQRKCSVTRHFARTVYSRAALGCQNKQRSVYHRTLLTMQRRNPVASISVSCSGDPEFKSWSARQLSWLRFSEVFLSPSRKCRDNTLN